MSIKKGVDPLGLQTITTDRIIPRLMPGVLALTRRARYLSFYSWLLHRYSEQKRVPTNAALSQFIKSREYEYALGVRLCPNCGSSPIGANRADPVLRQNPDRFERNESVESHLGGYGLYYRTPMRILGLVAGEGTPLGEQLTTVDVLRPDDEHAMQLAQTFADAVSATTYVREYMDSSDPLPREVLVEFGVQACLCRLADFPAERDALRETLLDTGAHTDPGEVAMRRDGFGLFLHLLKDSPHVGDSDDALRWAIWRAFCRTRGSTTSTLRTALARWAAVAAAHFLQDGMTLLWIDAGPALKTVDRGAGVLPSDLRAALQELANVARISLPTRTFTASARRSARDLRAAVDGPAEDLPEYVEWAREDGRAIAGLALMLATLERLPDPAATEPAWTEVGSIDGERQPGLLRMVRALDGQLAEAPTIGRLLGWAVQNFVIRPHEDIAYSKLPEFTFRFRWEAGRLRFYTHPFEWAEPGDIRGPAMASLTEDLGFCERTPNGQRLTADGRAFIRQVLG